MTDDPMCAVDGCGKLAVPRMVGLCNVHYLRLMRHSGSLVGRAPHGAPHNWLVRHVTHNSDDCLAWPFSVRICGYGTVRHNGESMPAHRRMCELAHGPAPSNKLHALHSCRGVKFRCVNPQHLRWGTPCENQTDRIAAGTSNRGERNGTAQLTRDDVREIRRLVSDGVQQKSVAKRFSVHPVTIFDINHRRTWAWLN